MRLLKLDKPSYKIMTARKEKFEKRGWKIDPNFYEPLAYSNNRTITSVFPVEKFN